MVFDDEKETRPILPRMHDRLLRDHFQENWQMAFLAGSRQVGESRPLRALAPSFSIFKSRPARGTPFKPCSTYPMRTSIVSRIAGDPPAPDAPISQLPLIAEFKRPNKPSG